MSLITSIKKIEPEFVINEPYGKVTAKIKYHGKVYYGDAWLHPEDKEYFASYVGCTIALARLKIEIFTDELHKVTQELKIKEQMFHEVTQHTSSRNADPTGAFYLNLIRCKERKRSLQNAIKREKAELSLYLKMQDETIKRLKRLKEQDKIG